MHREKGSGMSQYAIIIALIALALVPIFFIFGQTVLKSFTAYTRDFGGDEKMGTFTPGQPPSNEQTDPANEPQPNYKLTNNPDGSATIEVDGYTTDIPAEVLALAKDLMGDTNTNKLYEEVGNLINESKDNYPPGEVPIEIAFGNGVRTRTVTKGGNIKKESTFEGGTALNSITVQLENKMIILQDDSYCSGSCGKIATGEMGTYRIEGSIDDNNVFNGHVTSNIGSTGSYTANVFDNNGIQFSNGVFDSDQDNSKISYTWNIGFEDNSKYYDTEP